MCFKPTYKEWKLASPLNLPAFYFVLSLPTRNGNCEGGDDSKRWDKVLSLPTRNGNRKIAGIFGVPPERFKPTYKEWKQSRKRLKALKVLGFKPTYKEWKREVLTKKTIENIKVLSLPTRNGNRRERSLKG